MAGLCTCRVSSDVQYRMSNVLVTVLIRVRTPVTALLVVTVAMAARPVGSRNVLTAACLPIVSRSNSHARRVIERFYTSVTDNLRCWRYSVFGCVCPWVSAPRKHCEHHISKINEANVTRFDHRCIWVHRCAD